MSLTLMTEDSSKLGFTQDGQAAEYFKNAIAYLQGSGHAKQCIATVEKHAVNTVVLVAKDCFPMFCHFEMAKVHGFTSSIIVWDPVGLISARNDQQSTYQSPAIALLHEIGHAVQWIEKSGWFISKVGEAMTGNDEAKLAVENDNITTHETPVAKELQEGVRKDYNDALAGAQLAEAKKYYKTPYPLLPLAHK